MTDRFKIDGNWPVLVTGGAGYIGSHVCKALKLSGFTPVTYDNLSSGHRYAVKWGPLEEGDILDKKHLEDVIRQYKPIALMHFAGHISVSESVSNPEIYYHNNIEGTRNILSLMRSNKIDKIIFQAQLLSMGFQAHRLFPCIHLKCRLTLTAEQS